MVRVALFGSGYIARFHARAVLNHPRAQLVAVTNWREESARALAGAFGIPRVTTRWEELLQDDLIDAVIITTPNALHAPQTIACLKAGKHVLVEKPMARSAAEAEAMVKAAQEAGRCLMVGHMWRFRPEVWMVRQAIASGRLGHIVKTKGYGVHVRWGPSGWFVDPQLSGGGAMLDMGVHAIDTARYLLGDPQPVRVFARIGTHYGTYSVDDNDVAIVEWQTGAVSIVEAGWWHPYRDGLEADTQVFGTKGYARVFPPELHFEEAGQWGWFRPANPNPDGAGEHLSQPMFSRQFEHFVDAIEQGRNPVPGGEHGLIVMRIVDAAYRSARTGEAVGL